MITGPFKVVAPNARVEEFVGTGTDVFLLDYTSLRSFELRWEDCTFYALLPSTEGARGKNGGGASKSWRLKGYVRHRATYPVEVLAGRGGSPPPNWSKKAQFIA